MASKSLVKTEAGAIVERSSAQLDALRRIATQATPEEEIRTRPGRGGKPLLYTDPAYVIRTLNEAFGHDWDFDADNEELILNPGDGRPFEVKVRGRLTVRLSGQAVTKTQFGCQPIEYLKDGRAPVSIGDCYKGAASDALKKCASLLGIALDLYDSDSAIHGGKTSGAGSNGASRVESRAEQGKPQPRGMAGQILALACALKWDEATLINEIFARFNLAIEPERLTPALESMPGAEQQQLIQALKLELQARANTK